MADLRIAPARVRLRAQILLTMAVLLVAACSSDGRLDGLPCRSGEDLLLTSESTPDEHARLVLLDERSETSQAITPAGTNNDIHASFSPDGRQIVFARGVGFLSDTGPKRTALWVADTDGDEAERVTGTDGWSEDYRDEEPSWHDSDPDWGGGGIVYRHASSTGVGLRLIANPDAEPEVLTESNDENPEWSPDGELIAFLRRGAQEPADPLSDAYTLWVVEPDGTDERLVSDARQSDDIVWSPDGKAIVLGGEPRPHVRELGDSGKLRSVDLRTGRVAPLSEGVSQHRWSTDGERYYAVTGNFSDGSALAVLDAEGRVELEGVPFAGNFFSELDVTACPS